MCSKSVNGEYIIEIGEGRQQQYPLVSSRSCCCAEHYMDSVYIYLLLHVCRGTAWISHYTVSSRYSIRVYRGELRVTWSLLQQYISCPMMRRYIGTGPLLLLKNIILYFSNGLSVQARRGTFILICNNKR